MQPVMQGFDYAAQRSTHRCGTRCMRMWHCKERDGLFASGNEVYYGISQLKTTISTVKMTIIPWNWEMR